MSYPNHLDLTPGRSYAAHRVKETRLGDTEGPVALGSRQIVSARQGRTIYLHVGLPKTGTTFLQREVLPHLSGITFLEKPKFPGLQSYPGYGGFGAIFGYSPAIWESLGDEFIARVLGSEVINGSLPVLISDENISISLRYPSRYVNVDALPRPYDAYDIARHIAEMRQPLATAGFSRIRVILTIRRQDTWLGSAYAQDSKSWPNAGQEHFEEWVGDFLDRRNGYWVNGITLDFDLTHRVLSAVVGPDDTLILPYEMLREAPEQFMYRWLEFMGISGQGPSLASRLMAGGDTARRNVRSSTDGRWALRAPAPSRTVQGKIQRNFGRLVKRARRVVGAAGDTEWIQLPETLSAEILSAYADSNRVLGQRIELPLEDYGYCGIE